MINKNFKEFMENENNIDFNYQKIKARTSKRFDVKRVLNIAAVILIVMLVGIGSNRLYAKRQWEIQFKEYQNRPYEFETIGVKESAENGYMEYIDMEYVYQNDIGIKVDSFMITDDQLIANINFKLPENIEVDSERFKFGYAVYDENNEMYGVFARGFGTGYSEDFGYNYIKCLLKELNIKNYKNGDVFGAKYATTSGTQPVSASKGNIISNISMDSTEGFPKAKKLYIRIFDLGFTMIEFGENNIDEIEDFNLSEKNEWIFEIELPERMYNRKSIQLELEKEIPELEIEKLTISESKLVLIGKIEKEEHFDEIWNNHLEFGKYINQKIYITDNEGNIYYTLPGFSSNQEKFYFEFKFDVNKNMLQDKTFYLNIKNNGNIYTEKLLISN